MSELIGRVRKIALDVVRHVNGRDTEDCKPGIWFILPIRINGRDFTARFAWYLARLEFDSRGVYDNNDLELPELENHELVVEQVRRMNTLYNNRLRHDVLRRYGFRDIEQLRRNLR